MKVRGEINAQKRPQLSLHKTLLSNLTKSLCLREIYGLSPAELLYSNAVSQPKHQLGKHIQPASPQPASDNIKIHEKNP